MYSRNVWQSKRIPQYWEVPPTKVTFLNGLWQRVACTPEERTKVYEAVMADLDANTNSYIAFKGSFLESWRGSYLVSNNGTPTPPKFLEFKRDRVKQSNAPFQKRVREGQIVVSDYSSDLKVSVKAYPSMNNSLIRSTYTRQTLGNMAIFPVERDPSNPNPSAKVLIVDNMKIAPGARLRIGYDEVSQTENLDPFKDYDIQSHLDSIVPKVTGTTNIDGSMVTTTLANANHGQFDALANLAELPETLLSAFNGVTTIIKMYKEAKNKDIRIQNQISRLNLLKSNPRVRKLIADLAKSSANVWLTYRLGIKPLADTIDELVDLSFTGLREFYRYREFGVSEIDVSYPDDPIPVPFPIEVRCFIKRMYLGVWDALGWSSLGAVWELVPLSFVVDRYINLGNLIVAHTTPDLSVRQGSTYSWKYSETVSGVHDLSNVHFDVAISFYKRRVINPYHYCGLTYPPTRTKVQKLDHLALIWNLLMDDLVRPSKKAF